MPYFYYNNITTVILRKKCRMLEQCLCIIVSGSISVKHIAREMILEQYLWSTLSHLEVKTIITGAS